MKGIGYILWFVVIGVGYSKVGLVEANALPECEPRSYISCKCGTHGNVTVPMNLCLTKDVLTGKAHCVPCNSHLFGSNMCNNFLNCETCLTGYSQCLTCPAGKEGLFCENIVTDKDLSSEQTNQKSLAFPVRVRVERGAPLRDNLVLRSTEACQYPTDMKTAEVDCILYTNKVKCKVICVWGHTLPEGRTKEISCRYETNSWTPTGFQECEPYVDCGLKFKSPGDMYCVSNKLDSATNCQLSCNEYDDVPAVSTSNYECTLSGDWNPPLPFCMEKANEIKTVPVPAASF